MIQTTKLDLFAGIPVADYPAALKWYERLLGSPPTEERPEGPCLEAWE
jgi:hypothetical protein